MRKLKQYIPLVVWGVLGVAVGLLGGALVVTSAEHWGIWAGLGLVLVLALSVFLHIIIHEGGHMVCGLLSGYRFLSFRVGSIILYRDGDKLKVGKYQLAGTGGQCLLSPPTPYNKNTPYVLYHAGGSLANLLTSLVAVLGWRLLEGRYLGMGLLAFAVVGIALGLMNGVPLHTGMVDNDGMNIITLRKNPTARYHMWVQMSIVGALSQGVRIKDMPHRWFLMPTGAAMKNPISASLGTMIFNRHMDRQNFERAKSVGERLLSTGILDIHRYFIYVELLYIELITSCQEENIQKIETEGFKKFCKASQSNPSVCRTYYAYHRRYTGDAGAALEWRERFEKSIRLHPYPAEVEEERELMELVDKKDAPLPQCRGKGMGRAEP